MARQGKAAGRILEGTAAERSQLLIVSHAARLIDALRQQPDCHAITLEKSLGETRVAGLRDLDRPAWHWPAR